MSTEKKSDSSIWNFVIGGAIIGAIAGYFIKKIGPDNITTFLKQKKVIPDSISKLVSEFNLNKKEEK
ncbi:MAG: hypothetical protein PHG41_06180 [Actinomycetota bacterium]|nr:hypothetical protein [Actinomycetota bacterium]